MATKKREYEKPLMQVFKLKQQLALLAGSVGDIPGSEPYTPGSNPFSF